MTTKNLIPRGSGEGGIGITDVTWGYGYYDTGNFNKGLFVSGHNITQVIAETVTQGGLGGEWERNVLDIYYNGGNVGIGTTTPDFKLTVDNGIGNEGLKVIAGNNGDSAESVFEAWNNQINGSAPELLFKIRGDGNVGIGTRNPGEKLEVSNGHTSLEYLLLKDISQATTDHWVLGTANTKSLQFNYNGVGNPEFIISQNGDTSVIGTLCVGDTAATKQFDVNGPIRVRGTMPSVNNDNEAFDEMRDGNASVNLTDQGHRSSLSIGASLGADTVSSDNSGLYIGAHGVGSQTSNDYVKSAIHFDNHYTNPKGVRIFTGTGSSQIEERMRITSAGNVGIGTPDPTGKLHIFDSSISNNDFLGLVLSNHNYAIGQTGQSVSIEGRVRNATGGDNGVAKITFGKDSDFSTVDNRDGNIQFHIMRGDNGTATFEEKMRIDANGNVGIGTTVPTADLDINSKATQTAADTSVSSLRFQNGDSWNNSVLINGRTDVTGATDYTDRVGLIIATRGSERIRITSAGDVGIGTPDPGGYLPGTVGKFKLDIASSESLFMGCDDANPGVRTANTNKSFRVGGASYQYSDTSSIVAINSLFCGSDNTTNRLGIGFGTSAMQSPSEIVFATQAYNTFNQASNNSGTLTNRRLRIDNNGILVYGLSVSSDVQTNSNGYLITSSDKRLKNDLGDCEYGLSEVLQVHPKKYTWKDGPEDAAATIGFFAQDVHSIMPEAAPREAVKNENGEDDYKWGFHSQTIIAALVNATREQQQLIEDLRSEIEALKNK